MTPSASTARRLSDYFTGNSNTKVLESIDGQEVEVVGAKVTDRDGRNGTFRITEVTLADGRTFTVTGKGVGDPMASVPADGFPLLVTFRSEPSAFTADGVYWIAE